MEKVRNLTGKNINYLARTKDHKTLFRGTEDEVDEFILANGGPPPPDEVLSEEEESAISIAPAPKKKKKKKNAR